MARFVSTLPRMHGTKVKACPAGYLSVAKGGRSANHVGCATTKFVSGVRALGARSLRERRGETMMPKTRGKQGRDASLSVDRSNGDDKSMAFAMATFAKARELLLASLLAVRRARRPRRSTQRRKLCT